MTPPRRRPLRGQWTKWATCLTTSHAYAEAEEEDIIFAGKKDVKDDLWRCVVEEGQEWIFSYVLPQREGEPMKLVIPTSLKMGWIESPDIFVQRLNLDAMSARNTQNQK